MALNRFTVAIDGPSAAGKSTIAKAIAQKTGALHLDTGAMYRAIGLYMLRAGIDPHDAQAVKAHLDEPVIELRFEDGAQRVLLCGEDVTGAIRQHQVSEAASQVSAVPEVREKMVAMQQQIAQRQSSVLDGRDIGTKVLPDATLKIFLVAAPEVRARRRYEELAAQGGTDSYEQVLEDVKRRDFDDTTRAASPLRKADDAVELDSSDLTAEEVAGIVVGLLRQRLD